MVLPTFADVLPIKQLSSHQYALTLENEWCIGTVPNGGYVTSAFLVVARMHMSLTHRARSSPHPINLHLEFLRRTSVGPAVFTVKDVKLGSRISNLHITLSQKQDASNDEGPYQDEAQGYITMSNVATEEGLSLDTQYHLYPPALPVNLSLLASQGQDENYTHRAAEPFPSFRRAAQNIQIFLVRPERKPAPDRSTGRPRAMVEQWVRFTPKTQRFDGAVGRWTNDALGFLVDMFPQVVESYVNPFVEEAAIGQHSQSDLKQFLTSNEPRAKYWYPTLALNLDVKKLLPDEGVEWLFVRVKAKVIKNGRFDLDIEVWDEQGELVASSVHASLVMDASRNISRKNGSGNGKKKDSKL
ncbi:alpha,alpha-trehalose-phosphate synthase (UDP-forming) [Cladophialophora carrionii]|uniref:Alpha,alpha-trehalose-phosphate synthase (UDP-forming) n=1 Tax=Cladophialophora carrionii TaxID=86049 RepID=A0A1C1CDN5_9EURO|nr:alpha,alpha-trehalose-phosphate synthase (UDP-forming) [Cladophialophora carrionii]